MVANEGEALLLTLDCSLGGAARCGKRASEKGGQRTLELARWRLEEQRGLNQMRRSPIAKPWPCCATRAAQMGCDPATQHVG